LQWGILRVLVLKGVAVDAVGAVDAVDGLADEAH